MEIISISNHEITQKDEIYIPNFMRRFTKDLSNKKVILFNSKELISKLESKSDIENILIITQELFHNKIEKMRFSNEITIKIFDEFEDKQSTLLLAIFHDCNFEIGFIDDFINTNFYFILELNFTRCLFESGDIRLLEQGNFLFLQRITFAQCNLDFAQIDDIFNLNIDSLTELLLDPALQVEPMDIGSLEIAMKGALIRQLTYLRLSAHKWEKEHYFIIFNTFFTKLKTLSLDFSKIDDSYPDLFINNKNQINIFSTLEILEELECLEFGYSSRDIYEKFAEAQFAKLKQISFKHPYELFLIATSNNFKSIETIDMQNMRFDQAESFKVWYEIAQGYFPHLKKIFFPNHFTGEDLVNLVNANTVDLEELTFKENVNFGRKGMEALVNSSWNIQELNFISCDLTDEDFCFLFKADFKMLRKISIVDNLIGEAVISAMCFNENLRRNLEYLVLEKNQLKDNFLIILAENKFESLKCLIINGYKSVSNATKILVENVYGNAFDL
jgi:Leucine-rich repeat (LRR) protein